MIDIPDGTVDETASSFFYLRHSGEKRQVRRAPSATVAVVTRIRCYRFMSAELEALFQSIADGSEFGLGEAQRDGETKLCAARGTTRRGGRDRRQGRSPAVGVDPLEDLEALSNPQGAMAGGTFFASRIAS